MTTGFFAPAFASSPSEVLGRLLNKTLLCDLFSDPLYDLHVPQQGAKGETTRTLCSFDDGLGNGDCAM